MFKRHSRWTFCVLRINSYHFKRLFGHETRCCSTISSERPEFSSKTQSRKGQKLNEYHRATTVFTWYGSSRLFSFSKTQITTLRHPFSVDRRQKSIRRKNWSRFRKIVCVLLANSRYFCDRMYLKNSFFFQ